MRGVLRTYGSGGVSLNAKTTFSYVFSRRSSLPSRSVVGIRRLRGCRNVSLSQWSNNLLLCLHANP
jgi:hypothetical protein